MANKEIKNRCQRCNKPCQVEFHWCFKCHKQWKSIENPREKRWFASEKYIPQVCLIEDDED